jgi:hypothetical protein
MSKPHSQLRLLVATLQPHLSRCEQRRILDAMCDCPQTLNFIFERLAMPRLGSLDSFDPSKVFSEIMMQKIVAISARLLVR